VISCDLISDNYKAKLNIDMLMEEDSILVLSCDRGGSELHERPQKYDLVESGICDLAADVQTGSSPESSSSAAQQSSKSSTRISALKLVCSAHFRS